MTVPFCIRFLPQLAQSALMKALEDADIHPPVHVNKPVEPIHCKNNSNMYIHLHVPLCMYTYVYVYVCTLCA